MQPSNKMKDDFIRETNTAPAPFFFSAVLLDTHVVAVFVGVCNCCSRSLGQRLPGVGWQISNMFNIHDLISGR